MTTAEKKEILARIEVAEKELAELKAKVQNGDEVPNALEWDIKNGETGWCMDDSGGIYKANAYLSASAIRKRRLFKTEKYAQMYAKKTQFIADQLHFKWLYDRDFEPDWRHEQWSISKENDRYVPILSACKRETDIYFSNNAITQKCADWLNRKAGII